VLTRFDRVQIVVADRSVVARQWGTLLDAEISGEDAVAALGARRTTLAVGASEVELLEPDGSGLVSEFMRTRRGLGPFGVGFQAPDVGAVSANLAARGIDFEADGQRLRVEGKALGLPELRLTIGPAESRERVGLMQRLYEVTYLVGDPAERCARFADVFGLDAEVFCPIDSENFGYRGALTLLHPDDLDRIEIIHPHDRTKTMGRFFDRKGDSLYMCYGETDRSTEVRDRALEHAPQGFTGPQEGDRPDNLFLHHTALGGLMMGVSRTTFAWSWSGRPERIEA
jgi:hypothetical protein